MMDDTKIIRGEFGFGESNKNLPLDTAQSLYNIAIRRIGELDDRIHRLNDEISYCRRESRSLLSAAKNLRQSINYQKQSQGAVIETQKSPH